MCSVCMENLGKMEISAAGEWDFHNELTHDIAEGILARIMRLIEHQEKDIS